MARFWMVLVLAASASAQPSLRFKTRRIEVRPGPAVVELHALGRTHLVIQFEKAPTAATVLVLKNRGVSVLCDFPANGLLVSLDGRATVRGLGVRYTAPIAPEDKVSPLAAAGFNLVEFHSDVDPNTARGILLSAGVELRENPDLRRGHLLVRADMAKLAELARRDEVAYIFPASDALVNGVPTRAYAAAATANGPVPQLIPTVGPGWAPGLGSATVGYFFSKVTAQLDPAAVENEILRAMGEWSKAVKVTWQPASSATAWRTVNLLFATGEHGDGFPFTSPRVLSHSFYPSPPDPEPIAGDLHFNDAATWRIGADFDVFSATLHELGIVLGLGESDNPTTAMYPYYKMMTTLTPLDILSIQVLYAAQTGAPVVPTLTPLVLTVNAPVSTTTAAAIGISGSTSGGKGTAIVSWSTDRGPSGMAQGAASWSISQIPLAPGINTITITATDSAARVSQSCVVTRQTTAIGPSGPTGPGGPGTDTTPPSITILSPASTSLSTTAPSITFNGTASDNVGVAAVSWATNTGSSGTASGTTQWSATIPLLVGMNTVIIRASDAAGNVAWRSVVVTRH